ncbi:carbohydrate ABC transporter permease [Microbacterium sp. NPDC058389]|uniref:carbohydrate ABC transporter permease n=1 Tax=Microbacterium sp. NPDC058389 TaxID=3346475 RepID=UPI003666A7FE
MSRIARYLTPIYLTVVVLIIAFPILYAYIGAFRPAGALSGGLDGLIPTSFTLDNFARALNRAPLFLQLGNSVIVTIAQTALQVVTGIFAAYALVFGNLRFSKLIFGVFLISMMIPGETTMIANYLTVRSIGLYDTLVAVFLPFGASAVTIFLFYQAFRSFPVEIHEAAVLDAVGPMRFLWSFLVPLSRPTLAAATITCAIAAWNGYLWPLLITDTPEKRTVQAGISQMADSVGPDIGALLAGSALVSLPMIIVVIIGQSALTRGLTEGASK